MLTSPAPGTLATMPASAVSNRYRTIKLYQVTARMRLTARREGRTADADSLTNLLAYLRPQIGRA
ncbi:hypothetical protein [uncultured Fibrella sp.]|uniref:hypothetical protein n=1 Tax=uncultured Fibrella sp. TaxID=1284596 RepID=UPI0035C9FD7C